MKEIIVWEHNLYHILLPFIKIKCFLIFGCFCSQSWLRVSQQLHTASQVVVGAVLGYAFSVLWFYSWKVFVLKAFISYLWVRIIVVLGAIGFAVGFIRHVYLTWLRDENWIYILRKYYGNNRSLLSCRIPFNLDDIWPLKFMTIVFLFVIIVEPHLTCTRWNVNSSRSFHSSNRKWQIDSNWF